MTNNTEWGMRSMQDDPDSDSWGGQNVFDVFTKVAGHRARRHGVQDLVMAKPKHRRERGFTLIELMIVISMILILVSISIPAYNQSILRAKESVLRQDLFQLRSLISQYTLDKQKAPQSLDDLVQAGYIKQIPTDPMTGSNSTWTVDQEDTVMSVDQQDPGISDVHSGAAQYSSDGTAYSTW